MNIAYIFTCVLAGLCAFVTFRNASGAAWLWLAIAIGLLLIASLRASKTELLLDADLRRAIMDVGWYPHRRPVQVAAIAACALLVVTVLRSILLNRKKLNRQEVFATFTFAVLLVFAAIRSSSLQWTDAALEYGVGAITVGKLVQGICLAVLAISATSLLARPFNRRPFEQQSMKDLSGPNSSD